MKSLFNGILCASLLVFAVGCGKNNKSGGSNPAAWNNAYLQATGSQGLTALQNWYNGAQEGMRAQGLVTIKKVQSTQNSQNCSSLDLKIIQIPYCTYSYSSSSNSGTVISQVQATLVQDGAAISAKNNPELQSIFNGSAGTVAQVLQTGSTVFRVDIIKDNVITSYVIDTSYHSLLNPVLKYTGTTTSTVVSTQASCVNNSVPANYPGGCSIY